MKDSERRKKESDWDYPRPPRVEPSIKLIRIVFNSRTIAETNRALRVLETSHPPVYYIPPGDIQQQFLRRTDHQSFCEFKGVASYYTLEIGKKYLRMLPGVTTILPPVTNPLKTMLRSTLDVLMSATLTGSACTFRKVISTVAGLRPT